MHVSNLIFLAAALPLIKCRSLSSIWERDVYLNDDPYLLARFIDESDSSYLYRRLDGTCTIRNGRDGFTTSEERRRPDQM